jgi:5-methyltetrahydrofolate--homocysteine methyltransferase
MDAVLQDVYQGILDGDRESVIEGVKSALESKLSAESILKEGMMKPLLVAEDVEPVGKVVIGTVKGDLHDIGKNLVGMMMQGAGFEVNDLGTDVEPAKFVEAVKSSGAKLVAMSALLTTTMANMPATIEAFKQAGIRGEVKILVGGAPVTDQYARQIGADGYASDASQAARLALSLVA